MTYYRLNITRKLLRPSQGPRPERKSQVSGREGREEAKRLAGAWKLGLRDEHLTPRGASESLCCGDTLGGPRNMPGALLGKEELWPGRQLGKLSAVSPKVWPHGAWSSQSRVALSQESRSGL